MASRHKWMTLQTDQTFAMTEFVNGVTPYPIPKGFFRAFHEFKPGNNFDGYLPAMDKLVIQVENLIFKNTNYDIYTAHMNNIIHGKIYIFKNVNFEDENFVTLFRKIKNENQNYYSGHDFIFIYD